MIIKHLWEVNEAFYQKSITQKKATQQILPTKHHSIEPQST